MFGFRSDVDGLELDPDTERENSDLRMEFEIKSVEDVESEVICCSGT